MKHEYSKILALGIASISVVAGGQFAHAEVREHSAVQSTGATDDSTVSSAEEAALEETGASSDSLDSSEEQTAAEEAQVKETSAVQSTDMTDDSTVSSAEEATLKETGASSDSLDSSEEQTAAEEFTVTVTLNGKDLGKCSAMTIAEDKVIKECPELSTTIYPCQVKAADGIPEAFILDVNKDNVKRFIDELDNTPLSEREVSYTRG